MEEKYRDRFILITSIAAIILIGMMLYNHFTAENQNQSYNLSLQQLRGVTKLVIWEQDFQLNDITEKEKHYFGLIDTKESVSTTINGRMGFHIDLSDSLHTAIIPKNDTMYVEAPLQLTYINLDLGSLKQVKESSLDPSLEVDKAEVIKNLNQRALQKYLPQVTAEIKTKPLTKQEADLSKLCGRPVHIVITKMPSPEGAQ